MVGASHTEQQAAMLRTIAERCGIAPVKQLMKAPVVTSILRVTVYYHDRRALDSVGTLRHSRVEGNELGVAYRGAFQQKPIYYPCSDTRYEALNRALSQLRFDRMRDQLGMPLHGLDFWMVERAAGGFLRSVILAPETARGQHGELVGIIKTHLPETLRMIEQD